jgi:hypothetical protein
MSTVRASLRWHAFHTHKRGNAPDEYEDAFAGNPAMARFAVADGATESSFAGAWAKLLVEGFIDAKGKPWRNLAWLGPARERWAADVDTLSLPWFAEQKRQQGAYATLLGIIFTRGTDAGGAWHALSVGDSCLFRFRGNKLLHSFAMTRASDFSGRPCLFGSRGRAEETPYQALQRARGKWRPGDRFLLMTDALAEWMLRRNEQDEQPSADIDRLLNETASSGCIHRLDRRTTRPARSAER